MQRYWLRIVIGALATFGLGMLAFTGVRSGASKIERLKDTAEPINIPLAFIPFTVDGQRLGTLRGLKVLRSEPERVSFLEFRVKLDASADSAIGANCLLNVRDPQHIDAKNTFRCLGAADTAGMGLEQVGTVELGMGRLVPLVAPKGALDSFDFDVDVDPDSAAAAAEAEVRADSIATAAESTAIEAVKKVQPRPKATTRVSPAPTAKP